MAVKTGKQNTWFTVVLSFLIPGLGHLYVGKTKKGASVLATGYALIALNYILLALGVTSHHPELSFLQRLLSLGITPVLMLFFPFWIFSLLYGFMVWVNGFPLGFISSLNSALILLIITVWIYPIVDTYIQKSVAPVT